MRKIIPLVVFLLLIAVVFLYAPARLGALVLLGRSPVCPMNRAVGAEEHRRLLTEAKDRILYASKKLESDPKGFELWKTPQRNYWIPADNQFVLPFNLAEQDRGIYSLGDNHVKPGDVVLDCGANIGVTVHEWLKAGARLVVAIEPAPENIECLRRNYRDEIAAGKVIVYPKGVWDKDDWLTLHVDPHNSAGDSFMIQRPGAREEAKVPLTTIDKMVEELKLDRVDFIKMDIEGAEVKALQGGRATIAKYHPRMALSSYHEPNDPVEIPKAVRAAWEGYKMECGYCTEANWAVRPEFLFFQ